MADIQSTTLEQTASSVCLSTKFRAIEQVSVQEEMTSSKFKVF